MIRIYTAVNADVGSLALLEELFGHSKSINEFLVSLTLCLIWIFLCDGQLISIRRRKHVLLGMTSLAETDFGEIKMKRQTATLLQMTVSSKHLLRSNGLSEKSDCLAPGNSEQVKAHKCYGIGVV